MKSNSKKNRTAVGLTSGSIVALAGIIAVGSTGCGGGGGGGSSASSTPTPTPSSTTDVVYGTISDSGASLANDIVEFDDSTSTSETLPSTVTTSASYSIVVPVADITGHDTITILNPAGTQTVAVANVNPEPSTSGNQADEQSQIIVTSGGSIPPPPPI